jgi:hypothetical protein
MSEKEAKTKALEKHKKSAKCHCGKEKGHEGKHRVKVQMDKVDYEKKGKVRDEAETEEEEEEDAQ